MSSINGYNPNLNIRSTETEIANNISARIDNNISNANGMAALSELSRSTEDYLADKESKRDSLVSISSTLIRYAMLEDTSTLEDKVSTLDGRNISLSDYMKEEGIDPSNKNDINNHLQKLITEIVLINKELQSAKEATTLLHKKDKSDILASLR